MNDYLQSLLLGIIEGLTEFLPVSSTAHLRISEALLGISLEDGYWKMFSIVIQLGAILCLPIFFRRRIASFLATFPQGRRGDRTVLTHPLTLTAIAFICTAGPSFLLKKVIGKNLENLVLMGSALLIGGVVMWVVDAMYGSHEGGTFEGAAAEEVEEMGLGQAIWIGLCQNLSAVFPGTSRSMVTIAAGQVSGVFAGSGAGVLIPAFDPDDDRGHRLRFAEVPAAFAFGCARNTARPYRFARVGSCWRSASWFLSWLLTPWWRGL